MEAYDQFIASYQAKYPKATDCLEKDKEWLFTFYDFPAQHWSHLRTTNQPHGINLCYRASSYPANQRVWLTDRDLTMVFKLAMEAQKHWRRLNGSALLPKVVTGVHFNDGEELHEEAA